MSGPRILIVKTSSMGDVVHALPLASDLSRARPEATIDWVVEESFAAIPRLHRAVQRVIPIALRRWRKSPAQRQTWQEFAAARRALREGNYDAVIDCQGLVKSAIVARLARATVWGPDRASAREPLAARLYHRRVPVDRTWHAIGRNRILGAAAFGYEITDAPRFDLHVPTLTTGAIAALASRGEYAVLLTNASRDTKLWPRDRWREVEAWLAVRGLTSLLPWGSEAELQETEARAGGMRSATLVPRATLDQLAALLGGARIVIGLDTGLSHLAAAVGAPTIGIFCDYDPRLVGITGTAPCASLGGVDRAPASADVIAAAERLLAQTESA